MRKFILFLSVLFISTALHAQSAKVVTEILETPKVTYGQACYLSAVAQNVISEEASYEDAINAMVEAGLLPETVSPEAEVKLVNLAFIFTQMFEVKGGLFYRLTKGSPRYALKQLKADGAVPVNSDPSKILSGREALSLFTTCSMLYGENQFAEEL